MMAFLGISARIAGNVVRVTLVGLVVYVLSVFNFLAVVCFIAGVCVDRKKAVCLLWKSSDKTEQELLLDDLALRLDHTDVDSADCIELVQEQPPEKEEDNGCDGFEKVDPPPGCEPKTIKHCDPPKDWKRNKCKEEMKPSYAAHVAQKVKVAYPNLCDSAVDRALARRKATIIMTDDNMRPQHIVSLLPQIECMVFMKTEADLTYGELKSEWWFTYTRRGLSPRKSA